MMLMTTLQNEVARLDREISSLTRARFAALAQCDHITAKKLAKETATLKNQRDELTAGQPLFPRCSIRLAVQLAAR